MTRSVTDAYNSIYYVEMALNVDIYVSCNVIDYEKHKEGSKKKYANHSARVQRLTIYSQTQFLTL